MTLLIGTKQIKPGISAIAGRQVGLVTINLARQGGLLSAICRSPGGRLLADLGELTDQVRTLENRGLLTPAALHAMLATRAAQRAATARWRSSKVAKNGGGHD
jgi:hypothetical protein